MVSLKRGFFLIAGLLIISIISSCGGAASTTGGSTSTNSTTYAQSTPTPAPAAAAANTPAASTASGVVVKTAAVMVNGKSMNILTDAKGMTLYYFKPDTASKTACTGGCAQTWPPLLFSGTGNPQADPKLPGELEIYPNVNGKQIIYNDHPLYTYGGDTSAGQANGEGIGSKWYVVTADIAKNAP